MVHTLISGILLLPDSKSAHYISNVINPSCYFCLIFPLEISVWQQSQSHQLMSLSSCLGISEFPIESVSFVYHILRSIQSLILRSVCKFLRVWIDQSLQVLSQVLNWVSMIEVRVHIEFEWGWDFQLIDCLKIWFNDSELLLVQGFLTNPEVKGLFSLFLMFDFNLFWKYFRNFPDNFIETCSICSDFASKQILSSAVISPLFP